MPKRLQKLLLHIIPPWARTAQTPAQTAAAVPFGALSARRPAPRGQLIVPRCTGQCSGVHRRRREAQWAAHHPRLQLTVYVPAARCRWAHTKHTACGAPPVDAPHPSATPDASAMRQCGTRRSQPRAVTGATRQVWEAMPRDRDSGGGGWRLLQVRAMVPAHLSVGQAACARR